MRTEQATVDGKPVTIYIPDTPEEAAELERRRQAGEIDTTDSGDSNPGVVSSTVKAEPMAKYRAALAARLAARSRAAK